MQALADDGPSFHGFVGSGNANCPVPTPLYQGTDATEHAKADQVTGPKTIIKHSTVTSAAAVRGLNHRVSQANTG